MAVMERTLSPHTVPRRVRDYQLGKELGSGSYGKVYEASKEGSEEKVAIKAIDLRHMQLQETQRRKKLLKTLGREISILRKLPRHENIVELIEAIEEDLDWCFLVLELVTMGDLYAALIARPDHTFREPEAAYVFRQLIVGLSFLHEHDVIHRDLKLENVLVAGLTKEEDLTFFRIKITDFGLSKEIGDGFSAAQSNVGSPSYAAPEVYTKKPYTKEVDLWSLGALLYTLLVGRLLDRKAELAKSLERASSKASSEACLVLAGLLQVDPSRRSSLETLKSHSWLERECCAESTLLPCLSAKTPSHSPSASPWLSPNGKASSAPHSPGVGNVPSPFLPENEKATVEHSRDSQVKPKPKSGAVAKPRMRLRSQSSIGKAESPLQVVMIDDQRVVCILCNAGKGDIFSTVWNTLHDAFPEVHTAARRQIGSSSSCAIRTEQLARVWPESMARSGLWISGTDAVRVGAAGFGPNKASHLKGLALAATIAAAAAGLPSNSELPEQVQQYVQQVKRFRTGARGSVGNLGLRAPGTSGAHSPRAADTQQAQRTSGSHSSRASQAPAVSVPGLQSPRTSGSHLSRAPQTPAASVPGLQSPRTSGAHTPRRIVQAVADPADRPQKPSSREGKCRPLTSVKGRESKPTPPASESGDKSETSQLSRTRSQWVAPKPGAQRRNGARAARDLSGTERNRCSSRRSGRRSRSRSCRGVPRSSDSQRAGGSQHNGDDCSGPSGDSLRRSFDRWTRRPSRSRRTPRVTLIAAQDVRERRESRVRLEPARRD